MSEIFKQWQNILVQWVNCLSLQETSIQQIKEIGDGRFFHQLLNLISHKAKKKISTDQVNDEVTTFLKYEYPFYSMDAECCEVEDVVEITYITSLLLLHCVLKSQNAIIMNQMYKLDETTQVFIKKFFEVVLNFEGNVTRCVLKQAIEEHANISPSTLDHVSGSPLAGYSTPKRAPIRDVVESPLAQKIKLLSEQRAVIKRLTNDLDVELVEKAEMQEDLRQQREKTKKLSLQLSMKNDEIKKLREDWLYNDSELHQNSDCEKCTQVTVLKKEIKGLETYISGFNTDMESLQQERDSLQQKLIKAEHQFKHWHTKSQEYEAQCERLQREVGEKELELTRVQDHCTELQNHVDELKQDRHKSIEEDDDFITLRSASPSVGHRSPENLGKVIIDLQLKEKEEENKILMAQVEKLVLLGEDMGHQIQDLKTRLEAAKDEASSLKLSNLELESKVEAMSVLQHELEDSERKLNLTSVELDRLSQVTSHLEKELSSLQDVLAVKNAELSTSHDTTQLLSSDLNNLQEQYQESKKLLATEMELVSRLELEVQESQEELECKSIEIQSMKIENLEIKQDLEYIDEEVKRNVRYVEEMLQSDYTPSVADNSVVINEIEVMPSLCANVKVKVQMLNALLEKLDSKNLKSLNERSNLETTCKELNTDVMRLQGEIANFREMECNYLQQKVTLEECLHTAEENVAVLQTKIFEYTRKVEDLNILLEDKKNFVEQLEKAKKSLSDKNENLLRLIEESNEKFKMVESELLEVKIEKDSMYNQYSKLKETFGEQSNSVLVLNAKVVELQKQIGILEKERDSSIINLKKIIQNREELQKSKEIMEETYKKTMLESEKSIKLLQNQASLLQNKVCEVETSAQIADKEVQSLKVNLAEMNKNKKILVAQYEVEKQEKDEQVDLLGYEIKILETNIAKLKVEKEAIMRELSGVKVALSEAIIRNNTKVDELKTQLSEKEEYIKSFKTTMEFEITELEHKKEIACSDLKLVKSELIEVLKRKDELEVMNQKQNNEYKTEIENLTDKLSSLGNNFEALKQEKITLNKDLQCKGYEFDELMVNYDTLLESVNNLETANKNQLEELNYTFVKVEELTKENVNTTDELNIIRCELSVEKHNNKLLTAELSEKTSSFSSAKEESSELRKTITLLEADRSSLKFNLAHLTSEVESIKTIKEELMEVCKASENERGKLLALQLDLEIKIHNLELENTSVSDQLSTAKSDVLLSKEQHKSIITSLEKEIEEKEVTITQLMKKVEILQDKIISLESERHELCMKLEEALTKISEFESCKNNLLQLYNETRKEKDELELVKNSKDVEIQELFVEKNVIVNDLESLRISLTELKANKLALHEQHSKELLDKEEKIESLMKEKNMLQSILNQTVEDRNVLIKNLETKNTELLDEKIQKENLLVAHTKQLQETEENIMSAHKNALEVKAALLKKIAKVEGERDKERELHAEVENLLKKERENLELVTIQNAELTLEKDMISKFCTELKNNVCSLRMVTAELRDEHVNEVLCESIKSPKIPKMIVKSPNKKKRFAKVEENESQQIFYDPKRKLPAKPWNLDHKTTLAQVSPGKETSKDRNQHSKIPVSSVLEESKPVETKTDLGKAVVTDHSEVCVVRNHSEVFSHLKDLNREIIAARAEIKNGVHLIESCRFELHATKGKCNDMAQQYAHLTVANDTLKSENEMLQRNIKKLEILKVQLKKSEKDMLLEQSSKTKISSEKEVLATLYGELKDSFEKITKDYESLSNTKKTISNELETLHKENIGLNQKVKTYEMSHLRCEEECLKLISERQERELEFEKLLNSENILEQKMFEFQRCLKSINNKFEILVADVSTNYNDLKTIVCQKIELDELFMLMDMECEEISRSIIKCTYDSLKQTEENIENRCVLLRITIESDEHTGTVNAEHNTNEEKKSFQQKQQLDDIQHQIDMLISGIDIGMKKCTIIADQCENIMKNGKDGSEHEICDKNAFQNVKGLNVEDRTSLIKNVVLKLQQSQKKSSDLEMEEDGWNPEDSLEVNTETAPKSETVEKCLHTQHGAILDLRFKLLQELDQKTKDIHYLQERNKSLQCLLEQDQTLKTDMAKQLTELKASNATLNKDKHIINQLKTLGEEKFSQLESELLKSSGLKQAYDTLLDENYKLELENQNAKSKLEEKMVDIRQEYEQKLERLKAKMRILYEEEVGKKMKQSREESERLNDMCTLYKEKIGSYENDLSILRSQIWEIGDKLLLSEREKKRLQGELSKRPPLMRTLGKQENLAEKRRLLSTLEARKVPAGPSKNESGMVIDESITYIRRRKSIAKSLPSGMGMFDPEDEDDEVFNTTNLADLKAGRCIPDDNKGRISELQYRNSLCPPHLKSSYPAETQFHDPQEYKEEDLKGTEVLTPRAPLKESNDGACVRKASTPSRLKSLFTNKNRRDEVRWVLLLYFVLLTIILGLISCYNLGGILTFEI